MQKLFKPNAYHTITLNYTQLAQFIYESEPLQIDSTSKIFEVVRRQHESVAKDTLIKEFRNIIKFKEVAPELVRLLDLGGIWTLDLKGVYGVLWKYRLEKVCEVFSWLIGYLMSFF